MKLASARQRNVNFEENLAVQGKKQVINTPRRAFGDMKNVATPGKSSLKPTATIQKPTLQIVNPNIGSSTTHSPTSQKHLTFSHPLDSPNFDVSEEEYVEQCNLEEDKSLCEKLHQENSVVLEDPENEAEYWEKLMSSGNLSNIAEDDDTIEMCGPEDEPDDYSDILNPIGGDVVLTEGGPNFIYEKPNDEYPAGVRRYTLEEMEELFDTFSDVIIV